MPAQPGWLLRAPEILERLQQIGSPFLDRASFEELFGLKRRQAIHLIRRLAGFEVGNSFVVERSRVISFLSKLASGEELEWERDRRRRVREILEKTANAPRLLVRLPRATLERRSLVQTREKSLDLPEGISLSRGELAIRFSEAQDLLQRLAELAVVIATHQDEFEALVSGERRRMALGQIGSWD